MTKQELDALSALLKASDAAERKVREAETAVLVRVLKEEPARLDVIRLVDAYTESTDARAKLKAIYGGPKR